MKFASSYAMALWSTVTKFDRKLMVRESALKVLTRMLLGEGQHEADNHRCSMTDRLLIGN
jgi:hypothetical protein